MIFVILVVSVLKAWFSLAHKHKHKHKHKQKDIRTRRMAYLTQFSIPALLDPMINKMADEASVILLLICSHEVWVKVTYDSVHCLVPMPGLEVNFLVHLQSLLVRIFSTCKLVRPLANSFPLFGRHG